MMQYYGAGLQACYRGPRLFDTEETKLAVKKVVNWSRKYRNILNSDLIHLRRGDGKDWDGILHVNPELKEKELMMLYNPTKEKIVRAIKVPLYCTGLTDIANVKEKGGNFNTHKLNRDYTIDLTCSIDAESYTWFVTEGVK